MIIKSALVSFIKPFRTATVNGRLDPFSFLKKTPTDKRYISSTDPDASVTRHAKGKSKVRYKTHRAVDPEHEVITATKVTPGSVDDGHVLKDMIDLHEKNTEKKVETAVADSKYGTIDNFLLCHDLNIKAHIPSIEETHKGSGRQRGIFPKEFFSYNSDTDTFLCPAAKVLKKRHFHKGRNHYEYKASPQDCIQCELRDQCTRSKNGRTLKRHARKDELDIMLDEAKSRQAKKDLVQRKHLSERSFAKSTRYGFKRARWRSLWRMEIQDYLIAAIENIMILIAQPNKQMSKSNVRTEGVRRYHQRHTLYAIIGAVVRSFFRLSCISLKMA